MNVAGSPVIELIMGSLIKKSDGTFDLPKPQRDKLTKSLVARAKLPSAQTEANDAIRFAAFLGKDKNSPAAALGLAAAVSPMVKAIVAHRAAPAAPAPKPSAAKPAFQKPVTAKAAPKPSAPTAAKPAAKASAKAAAPKPSAPATAKKR